MPIQFLEPTIYILRGTEKSDLILYIVLSYKILLSTLLAA